MSLLHQRGPAYVRVSMTPMIDVVFLLVVFFVVVSQIVDVEQVDMTLPSPHPSWAHRPADGGRAVVNIIPGRGDSCLGYRVDGHVFEPDSTGRAALLAHLHRRLQVAPDLFINVRADRRTAWGWVSPVLDAARTAAGPTHAVRVRLAVSGASGP